MYMDDTYANTSAKPLCIKLVVQYFSQWLHYDNL